MIWRWMWREIRSMRHHMIVLVGSIAMGVAAMTAVHALGDSIRQGLKEQSRPMLAGDLVVQSMHPFPNDIRKLKTKSSSETKEMLSMVSNQAGTPLLSELKAIDGSYPLYGSVRLSKTVPLSKLLTEDTVIVEPSLLTRLSLKEEEDVWINGKKFTVIAQVLSESDRMNIGMSAGPRILISFAGLARSGLEDFGSRITRKIQFKTSNVSALERTLETIQKQHPSIRIQGGSKGNPTAERGVRNTEQFLLMVGFLSILIGIIGVMQSILSWLGSRQQAIATYRCLGMKPLELIIVFVGAIVSLTIIGSLLGVLGSYVGLILLFYVIEPFLPFSMSPELSLSHVLQGVLIGLSSSLTASVFPFRQLMSISPLAALRNTVEPSKRSNLERMLLLGTMTVLLFILSLWQLQSIILAAYFVLGLFFIIALLLLSAMACARMLGKVPVQSWVIRHALSSFRRPGVGMASSIVALGLGTLVTLSISLMQGRLSDQLGAVHPERAPSAFFIDIQKDQRSGIEALFAKYKGKHMQSAPVVMGRLSEINGESIAKRIKEKPGQSWAFTREQRLSFDVDIEEEMIVEGSWNTNPDPNDLCLEVRYADRLGLSVGDQVEFDVQGIPIEFNVRALRRIEWQSFNINFLLVGRAGRLTNAPQFILAAAQFSSEKEEELQRELVSEFPNVTILSVRELVQKAAVLLKSMAITVQGMGIFASVIGLLILIGTIRTSMLHRTKQFALLRALGTSRTEQVGMLVVEFFIMGAVATTLGGVSAYTICFLLFQNIFRMEPLLQWELVLIWIIGLTLLTIFVGLFSARKVLYSSVWMQIKE